MIDLGPKAEKRRTETTILREATVAVSRIQGVRVSRNNVGRILDARGVPVSFGLGEGSPDLVGIVTFGGPNGAAYTGRYPVRLEHLAECEPLALAFGIELKQPKKYATRDQKAWHLVAARRGIVTKVCRSGDEAEAFVVDLISERWRALEGIAGCLR